MDRPTQIPYTSTVYILLKLCSPNPLASPGDGVIIHRAKGVSQVHNQLGCRTGLQAGLTWPTRATKNAWEMQMFKPAVVGAFFCSPCVHGWHEISAVIGQEIPWKHPNEVISSSSPPFSCGKKAVELCITLGPGLLQSGLLAVKVSATLRWGDKCSKLPTNHPYSAGRVVLHSAQIQVYSEVRLAFWGGFNNKIPGKPDLVDKHYACLNRKHGDNW